MRTVAADDIYGHCTVNELLQRHPGSITVLNRFGVDACCGGNDTLAESAEREGFDLGELLQALRHTEGGR